MQQRPYSVVVLWMMSLNIVKKVRQRETMPNLRWLRHLATLRAQGADAGLADAKLREQSKTF